MDDQSLPEHEDTRRLNILADNLTSIAWSNYIVQTIVKNVGSFIAYHEKPTDGEVDIFDKRIALRKVIDASIKSIETKQVHPSAFVVTKES